MLYLYGKSSNRVHWESLLRAGFDFPVIADDIILVFLRSHDARSVELVCGPLALQNESIGAVLNAMSLPLAVNVVALKLQLAVLAFFDFAVHRVVPPLTVVRCFSVNIVVTAFLAVLLIVSKRAGEDTTVGIVHPPLFHLDSEARKSGLGLPFKVGPVGVKKEARIKEQLPILKRPLEVELIAEVESVVPVGQAVLQRLSTANKVIVEMFAIPRRHHLVALVDLRQ